MTPWVESLNLPLAFNLPLASAINGFPIEQIAEKSRDETFKVLPFSDFGSDEEQYVGTIFASLGFGEDYSGSDARPNGVSPVLKNVLRDLLLSLAISPIAREFSPQPPLTLDVTILRFVAEWYTTAKVDAVTLHNCAILLKQVVTGATPLAVWEALFRIFEVSTTKTSTPPPSIKTSTHISRVQTPIKSNSASYYTETATRDEIATGIRSELEGLVYVNTPGFIESYFVDQEWSQAAASAFERSKSHLSSTGACANWPPIAQQDSVLHWFETFEDLIQDTGAPRRKYCKSPNKPIADSLLKRKTDIFLYPSTDPITTFSWSQVLVVGELKKSNRDTLSPSLVSQVGGYVRLVFEAQHSRRFVHAFTLCGDLMRCWIFHRGGCMASEEFSVNEQPERFISVIVGYALMSMTDLGFDPTILSHATENDVSQLYVTVPCTGGSRERFRLESPPFFTRPSIASRGTTCWYAQREGDETFEYVCKDSWRSESYISEGLLLAEAHRLGVKGLVKYIGHEDVHVGALDDIAGNIMKGLQPSGKPLKLRPKSHRQATISASSTLLQLSQVQSPRNSASMVRKLSSPTSSLIEVVDGASKRCKSIALSSGNMPPVFCNRIHSRLVMSRGLPIYMFQSNLQFIRAFRDAIAGHQSLLRNGILHRDISINNIMIANRERDDGFKGFLIDLDLAIRLDAPHSSAAHHRTGTMEFMAIGALEGEHHTYRHDLESFYYVFLWICVHYDGFGGLKTKPRPKTFDLWAAQTYEASARIKTGDMDGYKIERILEQFTERAAPFKGLARKMRDKLFPMRPYLFTGTDEDPEPLYRSLLELTDATIAVLS